MSNIAWDADEETSVADVLERLGVDAVEIAPTKVFDDPLNVSDEELERYRSFWADHGVEVVAFQSMLFGRPDLQLFEDEPTRRATVSHLAGFLDLAGRLGSGALVFGSPKNRRVPDTMTIAEADDIATDFFAQLGVLAESAGTTLCLEPNPRAYDCNYVVDAAAGASLVARVNSPGFGLHLDAAGMALAGDDARSSIEANPDIRHFHISAPSLGELEESVVDHDAAAAGLATIHYGNVVSIEMRSGEAGSAAARVERAVALARSHYDVG